MSSMEDREATRRMIAPIVEAIKDNTKALAEINKSLLILSNNVYEIIQVLEIGLDAQEYGLPEDHLD